MDLAILLRLGPAVTVATVVAMFASDRRSPGEAFDEVVRVLLVGLVAGRLAWLVLGGPEVWRSALGTAILVRAGVETGVGVLVAGAWVLLRTPFERAWRLTVAVPAALAGIGVWQGLCQVEGVCGGVPVSWGVLLPGRASPSFPAGYVEAVLALVLFAVTWRLRHRLAALWMVGAGYALARVGLGFSRSVLGGHPSSDQIAFVAVAVACVVVARRAKDWAADHGPAATAPVPT